MLVNSKAKQVETSVRKQIYSGLLKGGQRLPAERDLLIHFGVSRTTLRDALNTLASEGFLERRQGAGTFVVNRENTLGTVALLAKMEFLSSKLGKGYQQMTDAARKRIEDSGFRFNLCVGHGDSTEEFASSIHLLDRPTNQNILGVLSTINMGPLEVTLADAGIPSVSIIAAAPTGRYCVVLDYRALMFMGAEILKAAGYDQFVIVDLDKPQVNSDKPIYDVLKASRLQAVNGDSNRLVLVPDTKGLQGVYDAIYEIWSGPNRPRAIFFLDDSMCDMGLRAISELDIKVPEELAILTQTNVGRDFHFPVPLARMEFKLVDAVETAWNMLEQLVKGEVPEQPVVYMEPAFQKGESL